MNPSLPIVDEVTTDEVTTDEVTTDEVTTDEVTTDEVTTDEVTTDEVIAPEVNHLITEDDTPVDNFASAKQQRLLVSCLYSHTWRTEPFLAEANVGIYHTVNRPPIVPDVFFSLDVQVPTDWWDKPNRCYMVWNFGKPPELALEIVSNRVGNELTEKLQVYAQMRVSYYIVYDPAQQLGKSSLRLYELRGRHYVELTEPYLEQVNLGLTLWQGEFEGRQDTWLRWCDAQGNLLLTGDEKAEAERQRAESESQRAEAESQRAEAESQRAEAESQRAESERQRADRLAAILREQGIDPDEL
ncbi:MAG: Uma2 family endonuclease [Cyanothece sp. SIO2G6]|nr:Uma2 family endonuclease [Cyanothece sp. SIO2G6]